MSSTETKALRQKKCNLKDENNTSLAMETNEFTIDDMLNNRDVNFIHLLEKYFFEGKTNTYELEITSESGISTSYDNFMSANPNTIINKDVGLSIPSRPVVKRNIPEPKNIGIEFVYNYYEPGERIANYSDTDSFIDKIDPTMYTEEEMLQILSEINSFNGKLPKYNRIFIDNEEGSENNIHQNNISNFKDLNIDPNNFLNSISIEGANSNQFFSGIELIDTMADYKIYDLLNSTVLYTLENENIDIEKLSNRELIDEFIKKITKIESLNINLNPFSEDFGSVDIETSTSVQKEDKILLQQVMNNYQASGIAIAKSDISKSDFIKSKDPISKQSFSLQFNNLFFDDIIHHAQLDPSNVYEDELRAIHQISKKVQDELIASIDPGLSYDHEYENVVQPYNSQPLTLYLRLNKGEGYSQNGLQTYDGINASIIKNGESLFEFTPSENDSLENSINTITSTIKQLMGSFPEYYIIGKIITKYEISKNGIKKVGKSMIITSGEGVSEVIDSKIAYGKGYIYNVRNICVSKTIIRSDVIKEISSENTELTFEYVISTNITFSEGVKYTVNCAEMIPPPPPQNLNVDIDYKSRKPIISWCFPTNTQRDIKKFQIYKRENIKIDSKTISALDQPFTLIKEYDFDNSIIRTEYIDNVNQEAYCRLSYSLCTFVDKTFELDVDEAIYSIVSVDAHGLSSNYSEQIKVKYDKYTNTLIKKMISGPGAPKPYPNYKLNEDFFEDVIKVSGKDRLHVFFDPEYYEIFRKDSDSNDPNVTSQSRIDYLKISNNKDDYPYLFHFINIDNQKDETLNIQVRDKTGIPEETPVADFNPNNLSFEYGV